MSKLTPSRISQQDASRIMFVHARVIGRAELYANFPTARNNAALEKAEAAFEALVAGMVQDEVE
jgi:hypothetical protein